MLWQAGEPEEAAAGASDAKPPPTVEEIEAEFWRIVETPDSVRLVPSANAQRPDL